MIMLVYTLLERLGKCLKHPVIKLYLFLYIVPKFTIKIKKMSSMTFPRLGSKKLTIMARMYFLPTV